MYSMPATFPASYVSGLHLPLRHTASVWSFTLDTGSFSEDVTKRFPNCPPSVHAQLRGSSSVDLAMSYDSRSIAKAKIQPLSHQLSHIIRHLCSSLDTQLVEDISMFSSWTCSMSIAGTESRMHSTATSDPTSASLNKPERRPLQRLIFNKHESRIQTTPRTTKCLCTVPCSARHCGQCRVAFLH